MQQLIWLRRIIFFKIFLYFGRVIFRNRSAPNGIFSRRIRWNQSVLIIKPWTEPKNIMQCQNTGLSSVNSRYVSQVFAGRWKSIFSLTYRAIEGETFLWPKSAQHLITSKNVATKLWPFSNLIQHSPTCYNMLLQGGQMRATQGIFSLFSSLLYSTGNFSNA